MANQSLSELLSNGFVWFAESSSRTDERGHLQKIFGCSQIAINEERWKHKDGSLAISSVPFGIQAIDRCLPLGGLQLNAVHEWIATGSEGLQYPPSTILSILAANTVQNALQGSEQSPVKFEKFLLWIGEKCWPAPFLLENLFSQIPSKKSVLTKCLFLNPPDQKTFLQAIDQSLRSEAVAVVIADVPNISFALSRRFALAARHSGVLGLFIRKQQAIRYSSAAESRWSIEHTRSHSSLPTWELLLQKQKGQQPTQIRWRVELDDSSEHWRLQETTKTQTTIIAPDNQEIA
jgi:protein ImuA